MFIRHIFAKTVIVSINTFLITFFGIPSVKCQITPDSSLGNNSSVINKDISINNTTETLITGGVSKGQNTFHSFQDFNINNGQTVYFENLPGINFIISRVTGNNPSLLLGTIGVIGNADLFFINPNGIIFGPDSRLNLNGSFFVSTASSINLSDGFEYSADDENNILDLSGFGYPQSFTFNSSAPIIIYGAGHNFKVSDKNPFYNVEENSGLSNNDKGLFVFGGEIILNGGIIKSASGNVELAGVRGGKILIEKINGVWNTNYSEISNLVSVLNFSPQR
jgi:filamentous hemagglutinin family protein